MTETPPYAAGPDAPPGAPDRNEPLAAAMAEGRIRFVRQKPEAIEQLLTQTRVSSEPLRMETLHDVLAVPAAQALYDLSGRILPQTNRMVIPQDTGLAPDVLKQFHKKNYAFSPAQVPVPDAPDRIDEPVLFGGAIFQHYGHFITDTFARLWALGQLPGDMPIVFLHISPSPMGYIFRQPYVDAALSALGIPRSRIVAIDRPTVFREIIHPLPSAEYHYKVYEGFDRPHMQIVDALHGDRPALDGPPIYLSRSQLKGDVRKDSESEARLEQHLSDKGFRIVHPETLPFRDQVSLFGDSPLIVGMIGSAFHNAMFVRPDYKGHLVMLTWQKVFPRYPILDTLKGYRATYIRSMQRVMVDGVPTIENFETDYVMAALKAELGL